MLLIIYFITLFILLCRAFTDVRIESTECIIDHQQGISSNRKENLESYCISNSSSFNCSFWYSQLQQNKTNCKVALFYLHDNLSSLNLNELYDSINIDTDLYIRGLKIFIDPSYLHKNVAISFHELRNLVDSFLTSRPWFEISHEPYVWKDKISYEIVLHRLPSSWEKVLKFLTKNHFTSTNRCHSQFRLIGRNNCIDPGWYSTFNYYFLKIKKHPFLIQQMYHHQYFNREYVVNGWISERDCENENTWLCSFLPTSNCSIPKFIYECNDIHCRNYETFPNTSAVLFYNDTLVSIDNISQHKYGLSTTDKQLFNLYEDIKKNPPMLLYRLPSALAKFNYQNIDRVGNTIDNEPALYILKYLLRLNYFYRSKVQKVLSEFYEKNQEFNESTPCIAAHIRRGDRLMSAAASINYTDYCYNFTHHLMCFGKPCSAYSGCGNHGVAFGAIELQHIVDKVRILFSDLTAYPSIIVFTDDPSWLQEQISQYVLIDPSWKVYTLMSPSRESGGTESGVMLFSSLELVKQCSAFVGHMGSGMTKLYHKYMCLHHNGFTNVCPPTYDMRLGLWYNGNEGNFRGKTKIRRFKTRRKKYKNNHDL